MTYQPVSLEQLLAHQGWALRVARRLVHEEGEAEDLVQRTWMAALRRPPNTERGARAWIRQVILNLARERHRRNRTRERHERASFDEDRAGADVFESLSRQEIHTLLGERLLELNEPYRTVVIQRFYEGLSSVEIARRLGIPAGTVRWRLKVGLDQLRNELDRRSQGDRSRWVMALVAFLPPGEVVPEPTAEVAAAQPALGAQFAGAAVVLVALGALGIYWFGLRDSRAAHAAGSLSGEPEVAAQHVLDEGPTQRERSPLAELATPLGEATSESAGLRVVVVDEGGGPVSNARVLVALADGFEERVRTNDEGLAHLVVAPGDPGALGLPATRGRVAVRALADGLEASSLVHVAPPFSSEHEVRLTIGGPEAVLEGRLLDERNLPIPDAVVAWFEPRITLDRLTDDDFQSPSYLSVRSDEDGNFRLGNLPRSRGSLGCLAPGFAIYSMMLDLRDAQAPIVLWLERGGSVSGTVRGPGGVPIANALVSCEPMLKAAEWATGLPNYVPSLRGFSEATRSDANGAFRLEGVSAWRTRGLWALDPATGSVASILHNFRDEPELHWEAELAQRPQFHLRLVDEQGAPLAGWFVHLRRPLIEDTWWVRRLPVDAEGRVTIPDCPEGDAFLDVFAPTDVGLSYAWRRLLPSDDEQRIEVETKVASSVKGRVVDAVGKPELRGQLVLHSVKTTLATTIERDEHGGFEFRLIPGEYVLALQLEQTAVKLSEFVLRRGEQRALGTMATPEMGTLRLNGSAFAIEGSKRSPSYTLYRLSDGPRDKTNLEVGGGPLEGEVLLTVFPGNYRVLAFDGSGTGPRGHKVRVEANAETRLDLVRQ